VLRHLGESGAVVQRDGRWVSDRSVEQLGIPEGVKEVIGRRLNRLSDAANQALSMAAVIGRDFDLGVLTALLPRPPGEDRGEGTPTTDDALVDALDEAVRAQLVNEAGMVDAYRFAHALVHETLYAEVSASKRVRLHRRIADAIATRRPDDVVALAHHYQQAAAGGDVEKAVEYSTRAGDQARARLAYDQAVVYYRQALDLFGADPANEFAATKGTKSPSGDSAQPSQRAGRGAHAGGLGAPIAAVSTAGSVGAESKSSSSQRCDLLIRLGEAQRDAGDDGFRQALLDAARLAQRLGDTDRLARAAIANTRGWLETMGIRLDNERIAVLNAALDAVEEVDTPMRAHLLATLANELTFSPERDRRRVLADEALAMARRLGDPRVLTHVLRFRSFTFQTPDTLAERLATAAELVTLAEQSGDPADGFSANSQLMLSSREAGDIAETDRQLTILAEHADALGQPVLRAIVKMNQGSRAVLGGRIADAERLFAENFEIIQASGRPDALLGYVAQLVDVRRMQGRLGELEPFAAQFLPTYSAMAAVRVGIAAVYCELDRDDEARALFEPDAAHGFSDLLYDPGWLEAMISYARVCAHLEARDAAVVLYERLAPWHGQLAFGAGVHGSVALYLGLLSRTLGRYDDAEAHFAEAHAMTERIGAPYWLAVTRVDWAKMLRRRNDLGDRERAHSMLEQALATAREYGFGGVERQATQLLSQHSE